jgi:hypothetical protein
MNRLEDTSLPPFGLIRQPLLFLSFLLVCTAGRVNAQIIQPADIQVAASILYAESASDPIGWIPKLNTYYKVMRANETLTQSMKRVSSAYRKESPQYCKAIHGRLNDYEQRTFKKIILVIRSFRPDPSWPYIHHENLDLYANEQSAISHLRKSWGPAIDFEHCQQIGKEHYFGKCH